MAHSRTRYHWMGELISGDCAGLTWYTDRKGRITAYPVAPPKEPPSMLVVFQRDRWRRAMNAWRQLTLAQRADYAAACHRLHLQCTGTGLWVWACCLADKAYWRTLQRRSRLELAKPPSL